MEHQERALRDAGADIIYTDAFTGTKSHRTELDKLLKDIQGGDMLIVTKLDRIARSTMQGIELIVERTQEGKSIAKQNPGFREGRPKKYSKAQMSNALELLDSYSYKKVSEMTGISVSSL